MARSLPATLGRDGPSSTPRLRSGLPLKGLNWIPRSPLGMKVQSMEGREELLQNLDMFQESVLIELTCHPVP